MVGLCYLFLLIQDMYGYKDLLILEDSIDLWKAKLIELPSELPRNSSEQNFMKQPQLALRSNNNISFLSNSFHVTASSMLDVQGAKWLLIG